MFKNVIIAKKRFYRKNRDNFRFYNNTIRIKTITIIVINNIKTTIEITTIIEIAIINNTINKIIKIAINNRFISRILDRLISNNDLLKNFFKNRHHNKKFSEILSCLSYFQQHKR